MSDLVFQNYNNRCQGWVNPSSISFSPEIISLSSYQSPSGSNTVVSINGINFYSYSTISFGTFNPTVYFVNSNLLRFYVPNTLSSGTFPVQVFNASIGSNSVNYTIDNASGFWLLNSKGSITNTNNNGVGISWLTRGPPITIDNTAGLFSSPANAYEIKNSENWIICDGTSGGPSNYDTYIKLPSGSLYDGREIMFKSKSNSFIYSTTSTIEQLLNGTNTTIVCDQIGAWSTLVYKYSSNKWFIMQGNWF
jgi:hypothetical protein